MGDLFNKLNVVMGKTVTIHQPCPFPPLYLFSRMASSDVTVFLSSAQFTRNSGRSMRHFEVLVNGKRFKIAIPVRHAGKRDVSLSEAEIDYSQQWVDKSLKTIRQAYTRRPCVKDVMDILEAVLRPKYQSLAELSIASNVAVFKYLQIPFEYVEDQAVCPRKISGSPSMWMLQIALAVGGTRYFCGQSAVSTYLKLDEFAQAGVEVVPQDFVEPEYPQFTRSQHESNLSIIDILSSLGPAVKMYL
jgi:hypothetical protein